MKKTPGRTIIEFRRLGLDHGRIDRDKGIIHDVSLITSEIEARGHDLHTDDTTLEQVCDLATEMGQVPVKWNHKTGADSVNGFVTNFRVIGNKTKADWHLLKSHPSFEHAIELAERMPQNVGLSAAFVAAPPETKNGKKFARVEELVSVDLVAQPAANPGGLFEAGTVDTSNGGNMNPNANANAASNAGNSNAEPTIADLLEAIQGQNETIAALKEQVTGLVSASQEGQGLSLEELNQIAQLDDAQLAKMNLTRAEVDQAVADAMAGVEDPDLDPEQGDYGDGPVIANHARVQEARGGGAAQIAAANTARAAGAGAGAGAELQPIMAELHDLRKRVTTFERVRTLEKQTEEAEAVTAFFDSIETKVKTLEARNQALETAFAAGGGSVSASGEFVMPNGALPDGARPKGSVTQFEELVETKMTELQTADSKLHPATARRMAVQFVQKDNRVAYTKHLETKGVQISILS